MSISCINKGLKKTKGVGVRGECNDLLPPLPPPELGAVPAADARSCPRC